jgi:ribosomal protein L37AE/L43A
MSDTRDAQSNAPPCKRCGAQNVDKISDEDGVILWHCNACGNVFGTPK